MSEGSARTQRDIPVITVPARVPRPFVHGGEDHVRRLPRGDEVNLVVDAIVVSTQQLLEKPLHGIAEQALPVALDEAVGMELDEDPRRSTLDLHVGAGPQAEPFAARGGLGTWDSVLEPGG